MNLSLWSFSDTFGKLTFWCSSTSILCIWTNDFSRLELVAADWSGLQAKILIFLLVKTAVALLEPRRWWEDGQTPRVIYLRMGDIARKMARTSWTWIKSYAKTTVFALNPIGEPVPSLSGLQGPARLQGPNKLQGNVSSECWARDLRNPEGTISNSLLIHGDCRGLGVFLNTVLLCHIIKLDHSDKSTLWDSWGDHWSFTLVLFRGILPPQGQNYKGAGRGYQQKGVYQAGHGGSDPRGPTFYFFRWVIKAVEATGHQCLAALLRWSV